MNFVDSFLNKITMYKLVLYTLLIWILISFIYCLFGLLPFSISSYVSSLVVILLLSYFVNKLFGKLFKTPLGSESSIISGLILFLVISPINTIEDVPFVVSTAILISLTKYLFAINKKHIFNPVAIALLLSSYIFNYFPSWWVGNINLLPFIVIGGFLIIKKIRRLDLIVVFLITVLLTVAPQNWGSIIQDTTLIFFMSVMLVEPLTTPPTKILRLIYGGIIGFLFYNQTPEIALVIGNIFSYIVSPKYKLLLTLKEKIKLTHDIYEFIFRLDKPLKFTPGQYMEFTFDHGRPDSRGNRRYLSLASSPTEQELRLGIKFGSPPSSYKQKLLSMEPNDVIAAGQLIGDFTLPKNVNKKLVLIAGGIGITPYRSMIKYLVDTNQKRDIVLVYTASNTSDLVYRDVFTEAQSKLDIKAIYVDTKRQGHIDATRLAKEIPDFSEREFYISGSHNVVTAFEDVLKELGVSKNKITKDYFPGFA